MTTYAYLMTPARRARILSMDARAVAEGARRLGGGAHVACTSCRRPIRVLSWVVAVTGTKRVKRYHYRCWKWGGVPKLDDLRADRRRQLRHKKHTQTY